MGLWGGQGTLGVPVYILAIPPYFFGFWKGESVSRKVSQDGLPLVPRQLTFGGPDGLPSANPGRKKTPTAEDTVRVVEEGGKSGINRWVLYRFTPAGLQSHCTVQIRFRQDFTEIYFFPRKITFMLTKLLTTYHNGVVPGPKWQGKSTFIVHVNQSSETIGPHVHPIPLLCT